MKRACCWRGGGGGGRTQSTARSPCPEAPSSYNPIYSPTRFSLFSLASSPLSSIHHPIHSSIHLFVYSSILPISPPHFFDPFILSYTHLSPHSFHLSMEPSIHPIRSMDLSFLPPTYPPFLHSSLPLWVHPLSNAIIPRFMMRLQCWPFPCNEDPGGSQHPGKSHL